MTQRWIFLQGTVFKTALQFFSIFPNLATCLSVLYTTCVQCFISSSGCSASFHCCVLLKIEQRRQCEQAAACSTRLQPSLFSVCTQIHCSQAKVKRLLIVRLLVQNNYEESELRGLMLHMHCSSELQHGAPKSIIIHQFYRMKLHYKMKQAVI